MKDGYQMIDTMKESYPVQSLCRVLGVNRSSYYAYKKREDEDKDADLKELISYIYHLMKGIYGVIRITDALRDDYCWEVNHKKVYRIMKELGLKAVIRKKKREYIRDKSAGQTYENVLNREFHADHPNEKWATDITEFTVTGGKRIYLSSITDLYNNQIVAHQVSTRNDIHLVEATVYQAFEKEGTDIHPLLHSDQGMQYRSNRYKDLIQLYGFTPSMSRKGRCIDNACIESFFSHFKEEAFLLYDMTTEEKAFKGIDAYISFYNNQRRQKKLNRLSPVHYRATAV